MSARLGKFLPIGLVAGAMGFFCWTHLDETAPGPMAAATSKTAELTSSLLNPTATGDLERDPFAATAAAAVEAATPVKTQPVATSSKGTAPPPSTATAPRAAPPSAQLRDLVLSGTYLSRRGRLAIINGSIYGEGEQIPPAASSGRPVAVARVDADKVVLKLDDKTTELLYTEPSRAADKPPEKFRLRGAAAVAKKTGPSASQPRDDRSAAATPADPRNDSHDEP